MIRAMFLGVLLAPWLWGCAGEEGVRCEDPGRYASSGSIPPVRVPDDLSPPDETNSLRIPPPPQADPPPEQPQASEPAQEEQADPEAPQNGPCLESPPEYFPPGVQ